MDHAMAPMTANSRAQVTEAELWSGHLAVLRKALLMRKPDARSRIRSEAARLEREIAAMTERRELSRRALRWAGGAECSATASAFACDQLDAQIAQRLRQVSDLAGLTRGKPAAALDHDAGGTPEAMARPAAVDPVEMLLGKGKLTEDQVRAAREIAWVHQALTKASRARVSRMCEIDPPAGWQDMPLPERAALLHAKRFLPWAEQLRRDGPVTLDIVLQVVVLGISVYAVARRHRLGWNGCVARLAEGLDRYWRRPGRSLGKT